VIAVLATPAGISGAVLLLPFQVSVLGTPSPAVTPTNLLYNVVATPGALYRYWRQGQTAPAGRMDFPDQSCPTRNAVTTGARRACPSVAGVITFLALSVHHHGSIAPDWPTGIALGIGGLAGAYTGARIQRHLPDALIRRVMGVLVVAIGVRYLWSGLG
jgi:uncharacterized membrane protein YfcA